MPQGIYHRVESKIIRMIETGAIAPGSRLPAERALAKTFKVSRNTVREAIRALVEKGIIVCRRGAGSFVTPDAGARIADALKKDIAGKQGRLAEIFEVRKMLEPGIAARAAETIAPEDLDALEATLARQRNALAQGDDPVPFDTEFHEILVKSTGNSVLRSLFKTMNTVLAETRDFQTPERSDLSVAAHLEILKALRARDAAAARRAMSEHMAKMETLLHQLIKEKSK